MIYLKDYLRILWNLMDKLGDGLLLNLSAILILMRKHCFLWNRDLLRMQIQDVN